MLQEIVPAISDEQISTAEASEFAVKTLDRFRNPYLDHQWLSISVQYSTKMIMRVIPLLFKHYAKSNQAPDLMAMGFAGFILFMKGTEKQNNFEGWSNGRAYPIKDEQAAYFAEKWKVNNPETIVAAILGDKDFWGTDLTALNGFAAAVNRHLQTILKYGAMAAIRRAQLNKITVG
jgi:tagaturonate reductase